MNCECSGLVIVLEYREGIVLRIIGSHSYELCITDNPLNFTAQTAGIPIILPISQRGDILRRGEAQNLNQMMRKSLLLHIILSPCILIWKQQP